MSLDVRSWPLARAITRMKSARPKVLHPWPVGPYCSMCPETGIGLGRSG